MRKTEIPLRRKQHHVKRRWCHSQDHKPSSPSFQRATKTHLLLRLPCPCPCSLPMVSSELLGVSAMVLHHPSNVISSNHALEPVYFWGTPLVLKDISSCGPLNGFPLFQNGGRPAIYGILGMRMNVSNPAPATHFTI